MVRSSWESCHAKWWMARQPSSPGTRGSRFDAEATASSRRSVACHAERRSAADSVMWPAQQESAAHPQDRAGAATRPRARCCSRERSVHRVTSSASRTLRDAPRANVVSHRSGTANECPHRERRAERVVERSICAWLRRKERLSRSTRATPERTGIPARPARTDALHAGSALRALQGVRDALDRDPSTRWRERGGDGLCRMWLRFAPPATSKMGTRAEAEARTAQASIRTWPRRTCSCGTGARGIRLADVMRRRRALVMNPNLDRPTLRAAAFITRL